MTPQLKRKPAGALVYVRKSTIEGERRSIDEQERACRELAERLGLPVVGVVAEEASAYAERVRPKFTAALQRAAAERLTLITWAIDRFSRRGAEAVLPVLKSDAPFRLVTVEGDDTADERQRLIIIIKAEMALQESQRTGRRVKRAREAARALGLWAGGKAPYGYQIAGSGRTRHLEIDAVEAAVVREIAAAVDADTPYYRLCREINARGIPSPNGKTWAVNVIKRILLTPALAGYLPREGDMVRDSEGRPVVGHEAILPVDQWERLQAKVKFVSRPGGRPAKTLLSGLLRCPCGGSMSGNTNTGKRPRYQCPGGRGDGKTHTTIQQPIADATVTDLVLGRFIWLGTLEPDHPAVLAVAEAWGSITGDDVDQAERIRRQDAVDTARARLQRTLRIVAEGVVDDTDAAPLLAEYRQALRTAEAQVTELGPSKVDVSQLLDMTRPQWDDLKLDRQRLVLRAVLTAVDLNPGVRGVDPARRVVPRWVGEGL